MTEHEQFIKERNHSLRNRSLSEYENKYKDYGFRFLLHYPNNGAIRYLMEGWRMILNHMGIPAVFLPLGFSIEEVLKSYKANIFITCEEFGLQFDPKVIQDRGILVGKVGSHKEVMTHPCHFVIDFSMNEKEPNTHVFGCPLVRIPFGCNPLIHYIDRDLTPVHDWGYFGTYTGSKAETMLKVFNGLIPKNLYGFLGGVGVPQIRGQKNLILGGEIPVEMARSFYSHTLVNLNFHQKGQIEEYIDVNERTFIIPACGGFQISDHPMAMDDIFTDDTITAIGDPKLYVELVEHFVQNPQKRLDQIEDSQELVFTRYTLFHSMEKLMGFIETVINE